MSATKHTSGPWRVSKVLQATIVYGDGFKIAAASCSSLPPDNDDEHLEERNANARLIAASPELLAVAEAFLCARGSGYYAYTFDEVERMARAAIAKAKGCA